MNRDLGESTMGNEPCLSEYRLDKHALGLETPEEYKQTQRHIASCQRCLEDVEFVRQGMRKSHSVTIPVHPWWQEWLNLTTRFLTLPNLAGAAVVVALFLYTFNPFQPPTPQPWIAKGTPVLMVALQRKGKVRPARSNEVFYNGDQIRLAYRWDHPGFLFVLHRDRHNKATPLYPLEENQTSLKTQIGGNKLLPGSFELEGKSDGTEEIWACFSSQPLSWDEVKQSLPETSSTQLRWEPGPRKQCSYFIRFLMRRP